MKIALHALVSGKVQGVWYRQSTVEQAVSLGVHGWCATCPMAESRPGWKAMRVRCGKWRAGLSRGRPGPRSPG